MDGLGTESPCASISSADFVVPSSLARRRLDDGHVESRLHLIAFAGGLLRRPLEAETLKAL